MSQRSFDHGFAIALYEKGWTAAAVAREVGATESGVRMLLRRRGIKTRGRVRRFDWEEAARLYSEENIPVNDIAERFGVHPTGIRKALQAMNIEVNPVFRRQAWAERRKLDTTDIAYAVLRKEAGWSWSRIAEDLGVNKSTIYQAYSRWLKKDGEEEVNAKG